MIPIWISKCLCEKSVILVLWFFLTITSQTALVAFREHLWHEVYKKKMLTYPPAYCDREVINTVHVKAIKLFEYKFKCVVSFKK